MQKIDDTDKNNIKYQYGNYTYSVLDVTQNPREQEKDIHPVMKKILKQIEDFIITNKAQQQKTIVGVSLGWDSLENETAPCGKMIGKGKNLSPTEAKTMRFNNADMEYFYQGLFELKDKYGDALPQIFIFLEGGYDKELLAEQGERLLTNLRNPAKNRATNKNKDTANNNDESEAKTGNRLNNHY